VALLLLLLLATAGSVVLRVRLVLEVPTARIPPLLLLLLLPPGPAGLSLLLLLLLLLRLPTGPAVLLLLLLLTSAALAGALLLLLLLPTSALAVVGRGVRCEEVSSSATDSCATGSRVSLHCWCRHGGSFALRATGHASLQCSVSAAVHMFQTTSKELDSILT
jgi:hypothetical protein